MMENQRKNSLERLAQKLLPQRSAGIFLEWRGFHRLVAEGIDGLLEYGDTRMTLGGGEHRIGVFGKDLEMRFLSETCIVIEGEIRKVCYLPEDDDRV